MAGDYEVDLRRLDAKEEPDDAEMVHRASTYREAQRAVDELARQDFPVIHLSIVARGLKIVEDVRGKKTFQGVLGAYVLVGGGTGALVGFLFNWASPVDPVISGLTMAGWGALIGGFAAAVAGTVSQLLSPSRGSFISVDAMSAETYDVICTRPASADLARRLLVDASFRYQPDD